MKDILYDRPKALAYAHRWALGRNPQYLDFSNLGGDCTNFISQCLFAGIGVMNYTQSTGWYYIDGNRKAPAWTAVRYLHRFLLENAGQGPYGAVVTPDKIIPGDIIQLLNPLGAYYHSLFVLEKSGDEIYIAAHSYDSYMRPLSSYPYHSASYVKILGGRR